MSTTHELYHLVASMSKAEKRYFKVFTRKFNNSQNQDYLFLYDKLRELTHPSDHLLYKKVKQSPSIVKKLPVLKHYLYQNILDALRNFNQNKTIDRELNRILELISVLFEKDLLNQAQKFIWKGRKLAEKYEKYEQLVAINNWEILILLRKRDAYNLEKFLEDQEPLQKSAISKLQNQSTLLKLQAQVFSLKERINYIRNFEDEQEFQKILSHPFLQSENQATSFQAKNSYYITHYLYQRVKGNFYESYRLSTQLIQLHDQNPDQKFARPEKYLVAIVNQIGLLMDQQHYQEAMDVLNRLNEIKEVSLLIDKEIFMLENRVKAIIYLESGDFQNGIELKAPILEGLEKHKGAIPLEWIIDFYHEQALFNQMANKPEKALEWVNQMRNALPRKTLLQRHTHARLLDLMVRYDLGDDFYLDSAIRSTYRFLRKRERLYDFEKLVLSFLQKAIKNPDKLEIKANFQCLDNSLTELSDNPNEFLVMNTLKFQYWVKSKVQNRCMVEVIRNHNQESPELELEVF